MAESYPISLCFDFRFIVNNSSNFGSLVNRVYLHRHYFEQPYFFCKRCVYLQH